MGQVAQLDQSGARRVTSNFKRWHDAGFTEWLLPIGPVGAKLSPYSKIDPLQVGKIPMVYLKDRGYWSGTSAGRSTGTPSSWCGCLPAGAPASASTR
jgi:hypothetical protein